MIRVIYKPVGCEPRFLTVEDKLENYQALVGGLIELCPQRLRPGLDMWANEEGLIMGLPANVKIWPAIVVGSIFFARSVEDSEGRRMASVEDDDLPWLKKMLVNRSYGSHASDR